MHYYGKLNIIRALISARFKPAVQIASDLEKKKLTRMFNYIWGANIFTDITHGKGKFISIKARRDAVRR